MSYNPSIILDGKPVEKITAFLFDKGGNDDPHVLLANADKSFIGSYVLGMGFTFDDTNPDATSIAEMHRLIEKDPRNAERIFPYIGGEEVNSSPTHAHHRYVINFGEMSEDEVRLWPDLMAIVEEKVKGTRGKHSTAPWWQFERLRGELFKAIAALTSSTNAIMECVGAASPEGNRVLVVARVGQHGSFAFLPSEMVFSEQLVVFPLNTYTAFCTLQSRIHEIWARFFGSSMKDDLRYTPSDCFETFPFPTDWQTNPSLEAAGKTYYEFRADLMVRNNEGLTDTYNRFHEPDERNLEILKLRELHTQMDRAALDAYGWQDIPTTCEFLLDYEEEDDNTSSRRKKPWRYRWPAAVHDEVLARLLGLNQQRHEAEILGGQPAQKKTKGKKSTRKPKPSDPLTLDLDLTPTPEPPSALEIQ